MVSEAAGTASACEVAVASHLTPIALVGTFRKAPGAEVLIVRVANGSWLARAGPEAHRWQIEPTCLGFARRMMTRVPMVAPEAFASGRRPDRDDVEGRYRPALLSWANDRVFLQDPKDHRH